MRARDLMSGSFQGPKTMQASCAARATVRTASTRPSPPRTLSVPLGERGRDDAAPAEGDVVRADRDAGLAHEAAVEPVAADSSVVPTRDERLLLRERHVLRRLPGLEDPARTPFARVERDPPLGAGRHPHRAPVRREDDIVGEERRRDRADELRTQRVARVDHGDPRRRVPEHGPDDAAVRADGDMSRGAGDAGRARARVRALRRARRAPPRPSR